ncbi:MAG: mechanosensitive ion channel family protein [Deltaproteobacteria bacterium]|nr:mechanosensitive ion channel family protein [Deltaproteobacteria bacterium]
MNAVLERVKHLFSPELILTWLADTLPDVVAAIATFVAFYVLWRFTARVARAVLARAHTDETAAAFMQAVLKYALFTVGAVSALGQLGVDTGALLASLGVAGLTVGFAAKDALSNLISGIFIFWDRPFVIGDLVEISGMYGRIDLITMRSTRVVTVDGKMLAIPNSVVVNSIVASYTNFPHLRIDVPLTVGLAEDYDRVTAVLMEVARAYPLAMQTPAPQVVMRAVNDYNVALELQVWIDDEKQHIAARFALRRAAYEALRHAKVDMPFETLQLAPIQVTRDVA